MTNTYIQLGSLGYLDVKEEVAVPLNFSIAEIQDISKKQGGFSKTIKLAGTSNNNNLLGHLFDVNIADASFNINIRQKCQIIQNGVSVFDGYLQLMNVNKLSPSSGAPDEFVEYEVNVKDDSGNFYSSLQEKLLENLPYWDQYNHIYTLSAITATSAHTVNDGYTYILPFKANTIYGVTDFTPAIYAKAYWDRIFLEAGYTYQWDSLSGCSFDKLIIPYNGDTPIFNNVNVYFRAGFETGTTDTLVLSASNVNTDNGTGYEQVKLILEDDSTLPNVDNGGNYNATTGIYTSTVVGTGEFQNRLKYELDINVPVDCKLQGVGETSFIRVKIGSKIKRTSGASQPEVETIFFDSVLYSGIVNEVLDFTAGIQNLISDVTPQINSLVNLLQGDTFELILTSYLEYQGIWYEDDGTTPLAEASIPRFNIITRIDPEEFENNFLLLNLTGNLNEGQIVNVQSFIPKQIKQKDFIKGITQLYNLYITPDKYIDNHLIIQTRDEYYDSGSVIDWTNKFALDNDAQIEFLPDLQDKRLILSYKQDNDEWNKQYQLATGEVYGQVQYEFQNEFTQSTKKIETLFSPTPIIPNTNGLLVPAIIAQNPKTNIRILYYNGWVNGDWIYKINSTGATVSYSGYPRALHLNDPINPTIDINYAQPDYFGYSNYLTVTDNNLYNKYWSRFINQIETGKLLKGTFLLDENDIHNLDLRSKVWLHDCYWNINRIIDYNPNGNGLTKVELISVDEGLKFAPYNIDRNNTGNTITDVGIRNNWITNVASINDSATKNSFGTTVVNTPVFGQDNVIQSRSQSTLVLGDGNRVGATDSIVIGQNNDVSGNNLFAFGNDLTLTGDSQAVFNVPLSATVISATTIFIDGSTTPIEPAVMVAGSAGTDSVKQIASLTDATGDAAFATGRDTFATGDYSSSFNFETNATGNSSHAEGRQTTASGIASHAEGNLTTASGNNSHAEGNGSQALGAACHAQGINTIAEGFASHAGGIETATNIDGEFASSFTSIGAAGQSQYGMIDGATTTVDATPTLLDFTTNTAAVNGWRPTIAAAVNIAAAFRYQMVCFESAANNARIITGEGLIKWNGGTPTLSFASTPSVNGDIGLLGVTATPVASGNGLQFQVTGLAATNLRWHVRVDYSF
jgi:hypothetical protein